MCHTGTGTEDREASRGSPETKATRLPISQKAHQASKKEGEHEEVEEEERKRSRHGGKQQLPSPSVPTFSRIKRRHTGSVGGAPRGADQSISLGAPSTRHRGRTQRDKRALFV